jgi:glycosyltransferase involved in cell wall biosynthesis
VLTSYGTSPSARFSELDATSGIAQPDSVPRPMRVSLVTSFPPSRGDLNEYGYHLACAMRDDPRVELSILADDDHSQSELGGFNVQRCWRFDSILNPVRLLQAIAKNKPDVVWFNIGFSTFARTPVAAFLALTVPAMARAMGYYTHITLHTVFERINLEDAGIRFPGLYRTAGRIATRLLLLSGDISVLLPSFRSELISNYGVSPDRIHARPHGTFNGAHARELTQPSSSSVAVAQPNSSERVILAFGYWGTYKKVDLLLDSIDEIRSQVPNAVVVVAGTNHPSAPRYLESLQEKWAGHPGIHFLGYVPEDDLPALFKSAFVLVLPYSSAAGTSGVVHQACQYGLPMVAAAIPEIVEIAKEERVAVKFYDPGDGRTLTNHLTRLLQSDDLRRSFSEQNLLAAQGTPITQVVDEYLRSFSAVSSGFQNAGERSMKSMQVKTNVRQAAGEWFLNSGIQESNGGVARYHFSDRQQNAPLTTEITAYYASALTCLSQQDPEGRYLDAAIDAATYLVDAWDPACSAMPFECEAKGSRYSYFFDNGIIVRGLLQVWRATAHEKFLATAVKCGDSMMRDFVDGAQFSPILELPGKQAIPYEPSRWSRSPGCYQLKAALGWYELWQITKNERYLAAYRQLLNTSVTTHASFLPGCDTDVPVVDRLHAYSYFLEGLLPVASETSCAEAMTEGIARLAGFVRILSPLFLRSDAVAQLLRVRLFADQYGVVPLDEEAAQEEVAMLKSFQSNDPDPRLLGGFWFGKKNGEMLPFMNPVSTAFCYQALEMWNQRGQGSFDWHSLI